MERRYTVDHLAPILSLEEEIDHVAHEIHARYSLSEAEAPKGIKASIYHKSLTGIGVIEGMVLSVSKNGVVYIPQRARKARTLSGYYTPFWMVVKGWGHPAPGDGMIDTSTPGGNVQTSRSMYRSTDPRWVEDFLAGPGKGLKPMAMFHGSVYTNHGLPETQESEW